MVSQKLLCSRCRNRLSHETGEMWGFGVLGEPELIQKQPGEQDVCRYMR